MHSYFVSKSFYVRYESTMQWWIFDSVKLLDFETVTWLLSLTTFEQIFLKTITKTTWIERLRFQDFIYSTCTSTFVVNASSFVFKLDVFYEVRNIIFFDIFWFYSFFFILALISHLSIIIRRSNVLSLDFLHFSFIICFLCWTIKVRYFVINFLIFVLRTAVFINPLTSVIFVSTIPIFSLN